MINSAADFKGVDRMSWQPLSVRDGKKEPEGPHEGVPPHLDGPLRYWLEQLISERRVPNDSIASRLTSMLRLPYRRDINYPTLTTMHVLDDIARQEDGLLNAADAALHLAIVSKHWITELAQILTAAGSVWTVDLGQRSLVRRVSEAASTAFRSATAPDDVAAEELREAWSACYGRNPNASDAWDHAIKAVEAVAIPAVVPKQDKAQIGHVIGQLDRQGDGWKMLLSTTQGPTNIEVLVGMLRLLWPNPDRHTGQDRRMPEIPEAQAVVQLAVTIVQWFRDGVVARAA